MSALAPRNSYRVSEEQRRESSDNVELSPASVWASDYEDDETTLQSKRVDDQYLDRESLNMEEERLVVDTPRQVRILDESQVLPGEASFATVSLNQPLQESTTRPQGSWESNASSRVDDYAERRCASRVRLLDESQILTGEASFETVMLGQSTKAPRHSPLTEFLVKTKLSSKQLVLALVSLFSMPALAVIILSSMMRSQVVTISPAPPSPEGAVSQSLSTSLPASSNSVLISNSQGGVSGSAIQTEAAVEEPPGVAEEQSIERSSSDNSRKELSSEAGAVREEIPREVNAVGERVNSPKEHVVEAKKQPAQAVRKAGKEQVVVKTPVASSGSEPRETRPEPSTKKSEEQANAGTVETKTPPTGGGVRPRTVTRRPSP